MNGGIPVTDLVAVDLVIAGGTVIDGSADAVPHVADVGIVGDRIVAIGALGDVPADRRIDATGLIVSPGFIDPHTHVEIALTGDTNDAHAPAAQGVTTILTSPDGFGWAPLPEDQARDLWAATAGIYGDWPSDLRTDSVDAYLDRFTGRTEVNVVPQVPHGAVRFAAIGWQDGPADEVELAWMQAVVDEWLDAGAAGLSIGLEYEPGSRASTEELRQLCEVVAARGGSLAAHIRYLDIGREAGYREVIDIGRATGVPVNIAHETLDTTARRVLDATPPNLRPAIETYLYSATSTNLATDVERSLRVGGPVAISERLRADVMLLEQIDASLAPSLGRALREGVAPIFASSKHRTWVGRDLTELAAEAGMSATRFAATVLRDDPDAIFVFRREATSSWVVDTQATITGDTTIVASDGIYRPGRMHPRGYGTFPRAIRLAVREWGVLSLPAAIHRMTGRTAARYRVPDRGILRPGSAADIVAFDPNAISDMASYEQPSRFPVGIRHVLVNGRAVVSDGSATGARPGRVIRAA